MEQQPSTQGQGTASENAGHSSASAESAEALRARVSRGSVWTLVGYGSAQVLRLVNNLILWRLLFPEAFGLMSLVNVFMTGLALFSDIGIGPSIVQHKRGDDPVFLNTAWTIQIFRMVVLCLIAFLLAGPVAAFYNQPQLAQLIPAAALCALPSGFNSTRLFSHARKIALGRLTLIDLASQVGGLILMIVWAWLHPTVWALVFGSAFSSLSRLVLSHTVLPGVRNRLCWDLESARNLLHFGKWIFFSTLLTFLAMQSDRVIFGKLIPIAHLGVYSIALVWATLPTTINERLFGSVLFPLLSRLQNDLGQFSTTFLRSRKLCLLISGWAVAGLVAGGPTLIRLLYEARATDAGWIIQILACGIWFLSLENSNGIALLSLGHAKWVAIGNIAKVAGILAFIPLGYKSFGFPGAVAGYAGSELLHYLATAVGLRRYQIKCLRQDFSLTLLAVVASFFGLIAARWFVPWSGIASIRPAKLGVFLEGLVIAVCVSAVYGGVYLFLRSKKQTQPNPVAA